MRPSEIKTLRAVHESIRAEIASLREAVERGTAAVSNERAAGQESHQKEQDQVSHAINELSHQQSQGDSAAETNQERRHGQNLVPQWVVALGTWLAFITAAIYAYEAHKQLGTMRDSLSEVQTQTTLMKQQLIATENAGIDVDLKMENKPTGERAPRLYFSYLGQTNTMMSYAADFQRMTDAEKPVGEVVSISDSALRVGRSEGPEPPFVNLPWKLDENPVQIVAGQIAIPAGWPNQLVIARGTVTYALGFGEQRKDQFCYLWVTPYQISAPSNMSLCSGVGASGGGWVRGKGGCPTVTEQRIDFQERLMDQARRLEQAKKNKHP